MAFMSLNGIDVSYDKKKQILKGLNLEVEEGELVSLLFVGGPAAAERSPHPHRKNPGFAGKRCTI